MKRFAMVIAVGVLLVGLALPALAQQPPPGPTVRFSGEMRHIGVIQNNMIDFTDRTGNTLGDNDSYYLSRLRLSTIMESADKKARATWTLEVGDIEWGRRGGASGAEYGCVGEAQGVPQGNFPVTGGAGGTVTLPTLGGATRVGRSSGGCLGNDGVNVETKHLNLWFEVPGMPGLTATIGAQGFSILDTTPGSFFADDAWGIKINWKMDPVDVEVYTFKISERTFPNADDIDAYAARVGISVPGGVRVTVEGMVINEMSRAGHSFGDTFWVGVTAAAKVGDINLDGTFVYGQRQLTCAAKPNACDANNNAEESGWGAIATAAIPVGPINVGLQGWYTSGDSVQGPGGAPPGGAQAGTQNGRLTGDSDKLPMVADEDSWVGLTYVAGWLFGSGTGIGGPGGGSNYSTYVGDMTGTYGFGGQVTYALTPNFTVGGGVAYVGATDAAALYGDNIFEVDGGANYRVNANLSFQVHGAVLFPDKGDMGYGAGWRALYRF